MRRLTRRRRSRDCRSLRRSASALRAPRTSCPWKVGRPSGPASRVSGLAMSCSKIAQRRTRTEPGSSIDRPPGRRVGRTLRSRASRVCLQTFGRSRPAVHDSSGTSSGSTASSAPDRRMVSSPRRGADATSSRFSSSRTRSADSRGSRRTTAAASSRVPGERRISGNCARNRATRRARTGSSRKTPSRGARSLPIRRSFRPPSGSHRRPWRRSKAIALTVSSLRSRSRCSPRWPASTRSTSRSPILNLHVVTPRLRTRKPRVRQIARSARASLSAPRPAARSTSLAALARAASRTYPPTSHTATPEWVAASRISRRTGSRAAR